MSSSFILAQLPILLTAPPALLNNNLTSSRSNLLCYVRPNDVLVTDPHGEIKKLPLTRCQVYQAAFASLNGDEYLVVTSTLGVQFWTVDCDSMISFFAINSLEKESKENFAYMRGIASSESKNVAVVGTSLGTVLIFGGRDVSLQQQLETTSESISAIAMSDKYLVCANDIGELYVYDPDASYRRTGRIESEGALSCCTCLCVRGDVMVVGYATGHLRIYRASNCELCIEVTAHARMVTGLVFHPTSNIFASCSEDTLVQFWEVSDELNSIDIILSEPLTNKLLVGVAFLSDGRACVASYDDLELVVFNKRG